MSDQSTWEAICHENPPTCSCCKRVVERVRYSMWHGNDAICTECFIMWYDPDDNIDVTNPIAVGNAVRRKHGLPSMEEAGLA